MMHGFTPRALTVEETIKKPCKGTMQVLVFESGCSGHRMRFTRLVAQAATALATRVVVALPNNARSLMEFKEEEEALRQCAQVDDWFEPPRVAGLFRAMRLIPLLQESIRRAQADWVYIPYADGLTQALGLTRGVPRFRMPAGTTIEALHLRGTAAYPQPDWRAHLKAEWSSRLTRRGPWTILHWLDPLSFAHAYRSDSNLVNRIRLMPDPALPGPRIDRSDARVELRVPRRGRYIGCVGKMDRRKGIDLLLGAFLHANLSDEDRLLLVGPQDASIRRLLQNEFADLVQKQRIVVIDRFVSTHQLRLSLAAMDVVCTPYPNHIGSSSIVIHAAAAGRPVLGSDFGWIGTVVPAFNLGWTCNARDQDQFARFITSTLNDAHKFTDTSARRQFLEFHSEANFRNCWSNCLRTARYQPANLT